LLNYLCGVVMKYFSMFSGIGGIEYGIDRAIRPIQSEVDRQNNMHDIKDKLLKWKCVGFSEVDKYAIQIYKNTLTTKIMEISQKSMFKNFPKSTLSLVDSLAKVSAMLESGEDSKILEALYSLRLLKSLNIKNLIIFC